MLVMAALLMADDLYEMDKALRQTQQHADAAAKAAAQVAQSAGDPKLERRLSRLAKRAEEIAAGLERP